MMAAPVGNQFWKLRSKHGRDKLFVTPDLLWQAACEYFEWCDENPWIQKKTKDHFKGTDVEETPTQRPYSLSGFLLYIDASLSFWKEFKKANHEDFLPIITRIEKVIETQQFEGAIVGAFNANIIARKLGLSDRQEITGKDGKDLIRSMSDEELRARIKEVSQKLE